MRSIGAAIPKHLLSHQHNSFRGRLQRELPESLFSILSFSKITNGSAKDQSEKPCSPEYYPEQHERKKLRDI